MESLIVGIKINNETVMFHNIYVTHKCRSKELVLDESKYNKRKQIYIGDFNSHHTSWSIPPDGGFDPTVNYTLKSDSWKRGEVLRDLLDQNTSLTIINGAAEGPTTTYKSVLDLCIPSISIANYMEVSALYDATSDHHHAI